LAARKGMLGFVKLFVKDSIFYIPGIGQGLYLLGFVFLSRSWSADQEKINQTFQKLRSLQLPFWLISHVEGTRFAESKHKASVDFAKKHDLPQLNHVLLPRSKGFVATLSGLRKNSQVKAVYDFTVMYNSGKVGDVPKFSSLSLSKFLIKPGMEMM